MIDLARALAFTVDFDYATSKESRLDRVRKVVVNRNMFALLHRTANRSLTRPNLLFVILFYSK